MTDKKELNSEELDNVAGGRIHIYGAVEPAPEVVPVSPVQKDPTMIQNTSDSCPQPNVKEKSQDKNSEGFIPSFPLVRGSNPF